MNASDYNGFGMAFRVILISAPKLPRFESLVQMRAEYVPGLGTSPKYPPLPPQVGQSLASDMVFLATMAPSASVILM
jgi:hypothetical protein